MKREGVGFTGKVGVGVRVGFEVEIYGFGFEIGEVVKKFERSSVVG